MTIRRPTPEQQERWNRAAALRREAAEYRAEAEWISSKGLGGSDDARRAAERRDRASIRLEVGHDT